MSQNTGFHYSHRLSIGDGIGTLATAFRWAERSRLILRSPLTGLRKPPKESKGAEAVISEADYGKLLSATSSDFQALLRLLWLTGCRPSEAQGMTVEAVDWLNQCVILKKHKMSHKGKARTIYLCPEVVAVLLEQKALYPSGFLFRTANGTAWGRMVVVQKMCRLQRELGVKATAYGFRHSYATQALANGVPDTLVAALLGHSGTAMLHKHYSHLTGQATVLRDALGKVR